MVVLNIAVCLLCLQCVLSMPMPTPVPGMMEMEEIEDFFMTYNYMGPGNPDPYIAELYESNKPMAFRMAAMLFQERNADYGLEMTGELDHPTLALMRRPRCGMPDIYTMSDMSKKRKRRYTLGGTQWDHTDLTYLITSYTPDLARNQVDSEIRRAFDIWQNVSPLTFSVFDPSVHTALDIEIQFVPSYIDHGDGSVFNGPSGVLAHAYFPGQGKISGDAHFDEAETWTINTYEGINLFQVAAHEFGHSLGLHHSRDSTALMYPTYLGYVPGFTLPSDDVNGIQAIYGAITPVRPDTCDVDTNFDAITTIRNAGSGAYNTYVFQGRYYFVLNRDGRIDPSSGTLIKNTWPQLPENIDTAIFWDNTRASSAATFVFKGNSYWQIEENRVVNGPEKCKDLPANMDAAFVWKSNGKSYFFKGDQYYRYTQDSGVDAGYPKSVSLWGEGFPKSGIDAALQHTDGNTYFFMGDQYYLYNDAAQNMQRGYPKDTADKWVEC